MLWLTLNVVILVLFHHVRISHFRDEVHVTIFGGSISLDELGV